MPEPLAPTPAPAPAADPRGVGRKFLFALALAVLFTVHDLLVAHGLTDGSKAAIVAAFGLFVAGDAANLRSYLQTATGAQLVDQLLPAVLEAVSRTAPATPPPPPTPPTEH